MSGKATYFASDFHLGIDADMSSKEREAKIIRWLRIVEKDAEAIYLLGDLFDFWFEYREVVPRGYVRLLGQLATMVDNGIKIEVFTGNHDMWMFDYFQKELNIPIHKEPIDLEIQGYRLHIGHGDGLGPGDHGYKFIKRVFRSKLCQWLYARLHPNFALSLGNFWSSVSRGKEDHTPQYLGNEKEWLYQYCYAMSERSDNDYYVFGHRHLPIDVRIRNRARYINLGDWLYHYSYGRIDQNGLQLLFFENDQGIVYP